ncbi:pickpocket protein 11-like isoform X2 [Zeugodacus cucurbitae]|nr:pickpocket protein 11-like isoform X2 [Zeugodacus cucurbitae]
MKMSVHSIKTTTIKNSETIEPSYYFVIFDDYLQPKKQQNFNKHEKELLRFNGKHTKEMTLNRSIGEKWRLMFKKFTQQRAVKVKPLNNLNETNVPKPKCSFQIYCEIASLHGFIYLVSTSRWQRLFWYFILCLMLYLSITTLWNSLSLNADNPTILYVGSKTGIMWGRSFPTITLCNMNRISKKKLNDLLIKDFSAESANRIRPFIPYLLYGSLPVNATSASYRYLHTILSSKNYTHKEFLQTISPDCESQLLRCKIHGQIQPCNALFRRVETQNGFCCAFNFDDVINGNQTAEELNIHNNRFGYKWGLTVLLDPQVEDYYASRNKFAGYQIYSRSASDFISINQPNEIVFPRREIYVHITPLITEVATAVKWHDLHLRRCYLPKERKLLAFDDYSQQNCFAECRSRRMVKICGCVPPLWPRAHNWTVCTLMQASCVMSQIDSVMRTIHPSGKDYKLNQKAERYICKCYPKCESLIYKTDYGNTILDRNYSISDLEF